MDPIPNHTSHPILYQDRDLLIVNKPSGVLSHPNPGKLDLKNRGAFDGPYDFDEKTFQTPAGKVWLLHRLDQDTSGVLLAALTENAARLCRQSFDEDRIQKTYLALVQGNPGQSGTWKDHLTMKREQGRVRSYVLRGNPPNAELRFKNLGYSPIHRVSLLEIQLITGKTHQIRVQASSRRHPLAGDDIYGDFAWNKKLGRELSLKRLFLHARQVELQHPSTRKKLRVQAALPPELSDSLQELDLAGQTPTRGQTS